MYESAGAAARVEEDLSWLGPLPEEPPEEVAAALREAAAEEYEAWKAGLDPWARFEVETGLRAIPAHGFVLPDGWTPPPSTAPPVPSVPPPPSLEDRAVEAQGRLVDLDRVARRADAARTAALVEAYEVSMADLADRFQPAFGLRTGPGAQAFLRSMALDLHQHPGRIAHLLDTALLARDRLPQTWTVYLAGEATWQALDTAVDQLGGLDETLWAAYDAQAARLVAVSRRLRHALHVARERLQDDTAPARARAAAERRRVTLDELPDGQAALTLTGPAADLVAFDQALTRAAILLHDRQDPGRTISRLRYDIALDLLAGGITHAATPGTALPDRKAVEVRLILTIPALAWLGHTTEQATLAGYGPIDLDTARTLAASAKSMVRVLTDPITGVRIAMDRTVYTPPPDLRRWLQVRDQHCRFPGCRQPAHLCDLDHAHEWHHGGTTCDTNLITACRVHHNQKTLQLWNEELHADGSVPWTNPWGTTYTDPPPTPHDPAPPSLLHPHSTGEPDDEPAPF